MNAYPNIVRSKIGSPAYQWDEFDIESSNEGKAINSMNVNAPRPFYGRRTIKSWAKNQVSMPKDGLANNIIHHRLPRIKRG